MVDRSYLVGKARPPVPGKLYLDQRAIPAAIDMAGAVEAAVERVAVQVRRAPSVALGAAVVFGLAVSCLRRRSA